MEELRAGRGAARLQGLGELGEPGDEVVRPYAQIAMRVAPLRLDGERLGENQPGAAQGEFLQMRRMPVGRPSVLSHVHLHRRDHDAVLQAEAAAFEWREKFACR